jgi:16S rRNA G966 N2-methylase RsmD
MGLLTSETKAFIREHADENPETVALQSKRYPNLPMAFIAQQVKARQHIQKKLPSWHANGDVVFPGSLSLEQCSSETAAAYKARLFEGESMADLTGGLGIDAFAFSNHFKCVYHIERSSELSAIVGENVEAFGKTSVVMTVSGDGLEWLDTYQGELDLLYVDPARRDGRSLKVSALAECEPNLKLVWERLLKRAKRVAVKLSPGLDIDLIVNELRGIREVHVISVANECKETFCIAEDAYEGEAEIICANERSADVWDRFSFLRSEEKKLVGDFSDCGRYLYEPNASIMKAGAFKTLGKKMGLPALHPRTRFYTSSELVDQFPGRVFEILDTGEIRSKVARALFPEGKANTFARNAGLTSDALKKKLKLGDGGDLFAIGTTDLSEQRLLLKCRRVL